MTIQRFRSCTRFFGLDPVNVKNLPSKAVRIAGTEQIKDQHVVPLKNVALDMFNQICKYLFPANSNWLKELVVNNRNKIKNFFLEEILKNKIDGRVKIVTIIKLKANSPTRLRI